MTRYGKDIKAICTVFLDQPSAVFCPGDEISGHVSLHVDHPTMFFGCKIVLEGVVLTRFQAGMERHHKTESILSEGMFLAGDGKSRLLITPPSTINLFNLKFPKLKDPIPGSYSHANGSIIYQIVAYLHNSRKWWKRGERTLKVPALLVLPPSVALSEPIVLSGQGPGLHWVVTLIQGSAYVIGEDIFVTIVLKEDTQPTGGCWTGRISLYQRTTFRAGPSKAENKVIGTPLILEIDRTWTGTFVIPEGIRPTQNKGLIQIVYFLSIGIQSKEESQDWVTREVKIILCTSRSHSHGSTSLPRRIARTPEPVSSAPLVSDLPTYSTWNLTRSFSSETLPPPYDEIVG